MLEFFGLGALVSCSILTGDMPDCLSTVLIKSCLVRKTLLMMMYAVAVLPIIHSLQDSYQWIQNWYADYSSCIGESSSVR